MKTKHWSPQGDDLVPRANINVSLCTVCVIVVILQYLKMYVLGAAGLMGFSFCRVTLSKTGLLVYPRARPVPMVLELCSVLMGLRVEGCALINQSASVEFWFSWLVFVALKV